jgi:hypothetical protein
VEDRITAGFYKNSARWEMSRCMHCIKEELCCGIKKKKKSLRSSVDTLPGGN